MALGWSRTSGLTRYLETGIIYTDMTNLRAKLNGGTVISVVSNRRQGTSRRTGSSPDFAFPSASPLHTPPKLFYVRFIVPRLRATSPGEPRFWLRDKSVMHLLRYCASSEVRPTSVFSESKFRYRATSTELARNQLLSICPFAA